MVGCHHRLNGHEFVQTPGDSGGQGSLDLQEKTQEVLLSNQVKRENEGTDMMLG